MDSAHYRVRLVDTVADLPAADWAAGQRVARGDVLVVLEAMKMEHALLAPRDGVIAEVMVAAGAQVTDGMVLLHLEPEDE